MLLNPCLQPSRANKRRNIVTISPEWFFGLLISLGVAPLLRLIYNQERQIRALETIIKNQQQEIDLLRDIVLEISPADVVKRHLSGKAKPHD